MSVKKRTTNTRRSTLKHKSAMPSQVTLDTTLLTKQMFTTKLTSDETTSFNSIVNNYCYIKNPDKKNTIHEYTVDTLL